MPGFGGALYCMWGSVGSAWPSCFSLYDVGYFPTIRSPLLVRASFRGGAPSRRGRAFEVLVFWREGYALWHKNHHSRRGDGRCTKSEEHTSELQSRANLVCRL